MRAIQLRRHAKTIKRLVGLSKQALREGAYRVARRLQSVVLNMEGRTAPQIADVLKVHRVNVSIWLQRWREDGMEGILEGHRAGRPPNLSQRQQQELVDILDSGPVAYGFSAGVWTCPMVCRVIQEEFSVSYHPAHVSRLLHALEFSVQRPRKTLARADKALQSRWVRYRFPDVKKKPNARERLSSLGTRPPSAKTLPSIKPGPG
ncbi:MAG: IS630 family transposase [Nitrospira sp. LK70]|nr:IS630 family transposase [Nitrospira sp. LK70]